ncbi:MAG: hypothetical protein ABI026_10250 [Gemmatimonadaceae bacterium]
MRGSTRAKFVALATGVCTAVTITASAGLAPAMKIRGQLSAADTAGVRIRDMRSKIAHNVAQASATELFSADSIRWTQLT